MYEILLLLLKNGDLWREDIAINEVSEHAGTALYYACLHWGSINKKSYEQLISLFLKHPLLDPTVKNREGLTALEKVRQQIERAENFEHHCFYLCPSNYGLNKPVGLYRIEYILQGMSP